MLIYPFFQISDSDAVSSNKKAVTKKDDVKDAKVSKESNSKEKTRSTEKTSKAEDKMSDVI